MTATAAQTHQELLDTLTAAGHDVALWADDPSLLRSYAAAVEMNAREDAARFTTWALQYTDERTGRRAAKEFATEAARDRWLAKMGDRVTVTAWSDPS